MYITVEKEQSRLPQIQFSTDLLGWNDAHMQSLSKIQHLQCGLGEFVNSKCSESFLEVSLVTQFAKSLTPEDNMFVTFTSSHCNRSPDGSALGFWESLRPDDEDAFCCSLFGTQS